MGPSLGPYADFLTWVCDSGRGTFRFTISRTTNVPCHFCKPTSWQSLSLPTHRCGVNVRVGACVCVCGRVRDLVGIIVGWCGRKWRWRWRGDGGSWRASGRACGRLCVRGDGVEFVGRVLEDLGRTRVCLANTQGADSDDCRRHSLLSVESRLWLVHARDAWGDAFGLGNLPP